MEKQIMKEITKKLGKELEPKLKKALEDMKPELDSFVKKIIERLFK